MDFYSLLEEHVCFPGTKPYMCVFFYWEDFDTELSSCMYLFHFRNLKRSVD